MSISSNVLELAETLPEPAKEVFIKYHESLAIAGRAKNGSSNTILLDFIADLEKAFNKQWELYCNNCGKCIDHTIKGSGI